ncbi:hypothetical protein OHA25_39090 [Nonomuraea sp. NBC_00507]|uniref:hypothetical protein n=1 Tax=Nonomuraea sp. NBC_00507 TaxID=2976002 RepID=UPI002E17EE22
MTSENPVQDGSQPPGTTSENTKSAADAARPKQHGARPTPLPVGYQQTLADYSAALEQVPLAADTRRTYASRVRMYLAWLAGRPAALNGDPLTDRRARDWAVRDYRHYLLREPTPNARCATSTTPWPPWTTSTSGAAWARPTSAARTSPRPRPRR